LNGEVYTPGMENIGAQLGAEGKGGHMGGKNGPAGALTGKTPL